MKKIAIAPIVAFAALLAGGATRIVQDQCGPFTDVPPALCPYVAEMYYLGITAGTSATTYSPDNPVTRGQAAVFASKGINQALARSSRRAALGQWWTTTPHWDVGLGVSPVGDTPESCACDGADVWVASAALNRGENGTVARVRASDGRVIETWTGALDATGVLVAAGRVFVTSPGTNTVYVIDPSQPAGAVTPLATNLPPFPGAIAFDGAKLWTANGSGSISSIDPATGALGGFTGFSGPSGITFDGAHLWITDATAGTLVGLAPDGTPFHTVTVGAVPVNPVFDGANVWVPNNGDGTVTVVQASTGAVVTTLSGNGLDQPIAAAFDGRRVLVTNLHANAVSLWNAADLSSIGTFPTGAGSGPGGACSDGVHFWVSLTGMSQIGRY